ncbi:hypothetical protein FACS18949_07640 [Clostridia bacterium]|nr:hypothetical protein FACS18949_07640 [Clostridia bacterium]
MSPVKERLISSIGLIDDETAVALYSIVEKILVSLDDDYTFVTRSEEASIRQGREEISNGKFVTLESII